MAAPGLGDLADARSVKVTPTGNMARFGATRVRLGKISSLAMSQHAVVTAGVEPLATRFHRFVCAVGEPH